MPSPPPAPAAAPDSPLAAAARAEADLRFDTAMAQLYDVQLERPGTSDAQAARLRLARLLALAGNLPSALLECQLLRDELPADHPVRERAVELATILARQLRVAGGQTLSVFPTLEALATRGLPTLQEPTAIEFESEGRFVILDEGGGRVFRVAPEGASQLPSPLEPSAIATLRDGTVLIAGKTGLATAPPSRTVPLTATLGGKMRTLKKARSMATWSSGELLLIDKDFDGLLRCQPATGACAQWGPLGKFRAVKVGGGDWVYLLDDRGQFVRVVDPAARQLATIGPVVGTAKFGKIEDFAVDGAYGLYLLDTDLKRVSIVQLRSAGDGKITAVGAPGVPFPQEGDRAVKNTSAIGVSPGGWVAVAAKAAPRVMRLR
jgi:hypothetical protein